MTSDELLAAFHTASEEADEMKRRWLAADYPGPHEAAIYALWTGKLREAGRLLAELRRRGVDVGPVGASILVESYTNRATDVVVRAAL